jgi:hypothetical protein
VFVVFVASLAMLAGCGGGSTVTPPPTATVNTPPTIDSLAIAGGRAEADRPVQVAAVVSDTESQLSQMTYTWSAMPQGGLFGGLTSFAGNQATNTWRAPKGQLSPDLYTVSLTVTESFTSAGQPKQNAVSKTATVHYNDSPKEVTEIGYDFLVNRFGNYSVSPADAVKNFSDSCPGKADELDDVKDNRAAVKIISASFIAAPPTFNDSLTAGTVEGGCQFEDVPNSGENAGKREFVSGTCVLTTVYENFRWFLCDSTFQPPYKTTLASLKGRVPGRIIFP